MTRASRDPLAPVLRVVARPPRGTPEPVAPRPQLDDVEILEGLRRGDRLALRALHDRVRPQVEKAILRILGRRDEEHDDLVQLALIQLVESMPRFRGECSLDTWTGRVTAYTVYNQLPKRRSARRVFSETPLDEVECAAPGNPESHVTDRSTIARVRGHLDAIESKKAWTLVLHDVCGYDLHEIAQITDVTVAAAQARLVRGRHELQARLEADPELADMLSARVRSR